MGYDVYLVAVMDGFSWDVLAWELSNSLDGAFCQMTLQQALPRSTPRIFTTDQGNRFTAQGCTALLEAATVQSSMNGRGASTTTCLLSGGGGP